MLHLLLLTLCSQIQTENWTEFRGNNGTGLAAPTANPPTKWSETENLRWKTAIHGKGWSSPVVWDKQIWLTTADEDGKKLYACAVDFDSGKLLHVLTLFTVDKPDFCHPTNSYASCSPTIEAGRVYVHFGSYGTACLDTATGQKLWERRDFPCDHFRAPGSSLVLFEDLLLLSFDGVDQQYLVALNKTDGKTVWQKKRSINYGTDNGDNKKAYSTPGLFTQNGKTVMISPGAAATICYDPKTGEELWICYHGGMNASARVLHGQGQFYLNAGDGGKAMIAIAENGSGDITKTHLKWSVAKAMPKRSSPILVDEHLYAMSDQGIASCLEAKTGKEVWQSRIANFNCWASPVHGAGRLYFFGQDGTTVVLATGKEFKNLAMNKLEAGGNSSPVIIGNSLILRSKSHLYRLAEKE